MSAPDKLREFAQKIGATGTGFYVHPACWNPFLDSVHKGGPIYSHQGSLKHQHQVEEALLEFDCSIVWKRADLHALYPEITHCDHCDQAFKATDLEIGNFWITTAEERKDQERARQLFLERLPRTTGAMLLAIAWVLELIHRVLIPHILILFVPLMVVLGVAYLAFGSRVNMWLRSLDHLQRRWKEGPADNRTLLACLILCLGYFFLVLWMFPSRR